MIFLKNPKKRKEHKVAKTKRKPPKGFRTWKGYMASIRPKSKKRSATPMKKRRKAKKRATTRTVTRYRTRKAPVKRRKYRRNPSIKRMGKGFIGMLLQGSIDTVEVTLGKVVARTIPTMVNIPTSGPMGLIVQTAVAVAVGFVGHQFVSKNAGKMMLAGALSAPVESIIKQANIPFISAGLGEEPEIVEIGGMGAYPSLGAYPEMGMGEEDLITEDEESMAYAQ